MITSMTLAQLVTEILSSQVMTAEQETKLFDLIEEHNYTMEDMQLVNQLVDAIRDGLIELPDRLVS